MERKKYEPVLMYKGSQLIRKSNVKYLGIIFDQKLTWKDHINDLIEKYKKPLQVMEIVAGNGWGGDRNSLKLLYFSLVRSKIDYASFIYSSAC